LKNQKGGGKREELEENVGGRTREEETFVK